MTKLVPNRSAVVLSVSFASLLGVALSGCTPAAAPQPQVSTESPVIVESAQTDSVIFAAQKKQLQDQRPGAVFHESLSGIGPKEIKVPAVPKGTTMIGAAINCDEGGNWNLSVSQKTPARSEAQCSLGVTPAIEFPIDNKLGENKLVLEVNKDSHFWISIYYK